uniref:Uncharacterized protein n=1 Tax=Haemonchus placei TaxID=6290 RepID=A0A0N4X510_HAEPC
LTDTVGLRGTLPTSNIDPGFDRIDTRYGRRRRLVKCESAQTTTTQQLFAKTDYFFPSLAALTPRAHLVHSYSKENLTGNPY